MGDDLRKVRTGDPLRIPASAYNRFIDAARFVRERGHDLAGGRGNDEHRCGGIIHIRNDTEGDLDRYNIVGLGDPLFPPEEAAEQFANGVVLKGEALEEKHRGNFAVLLEPAPTGGIARAMLSGVCVAKVNFLEKDHVRADISDQTAHLDSSVAGSAQILWSEEQPETGVKWAVLRIGAVDESFPARITGHSTQAMDHPQWGEHAWEEIIWDDKEGEEPGEWKTIENGRSGEVGSDQAAREVNGRPALREGTIVLMHRMGERYFFSKDGGPVQEQPKSMGGDEVTLLDLDEEESVEQGLWFDRDHVHNSGPMNRHDPDIEPEGEHPQAYSGAWLARFVSKVEFVGYEDESGSGSGGGSGGGSASSEEPCIEKIIIHERMLHGDQDGHLEWIDVRKEHVIELVEAEVGVPLRVQFPENVGSGQADRCDGECVPPEHCPTKARLHRLLSRT